MKTCLVSYTAPYSIPYIDYYIRAINEFGHKCDVVFWDRDADFDCDASGKITYRSYSSAAKPTQSKIVKYLKYIPATRFIINQIKTNEYDRVIFLQTHAAIACKKVLMKNYRRKYIVDIRDFTLENFSFYRSAEKCVIENAFSTIISSEGYKSFLPQHDYVLGHNYTSVNMEEWESLRLSKIKEKPINISFIGNIRFFDTAKRLLNIFKNDGRFRLSFIGNGSEALREFCHDNQIMNVTLHGKFKMEDTLSFYSECHIINNFYGNNNRYLDYALSNKLYYAAQLRLPLLVSENTYSSKIANEYGFGITWNPDTPNAADDLYKMYMKIKNTSIEKGCEAFLEKVNQDNLEYKNTLKTFLSPGEND